MASFKNFCDKTDYCFDDYWNEKSTNEVHHFIGKDIINFHTLFWPAMLSSANYRKPSAVHAHGFLTVNGTKMSKSRGTFINASTYLKHLDAEYLRYYLASKLSSGVDDLDLNLEDFVQKVNSDLVGKLANIASRCAGFIHKNFEGKLAENLDTREIIDDIQSKQQDIAELYEKLDFSKAVRLIMASADLANKYINEKQPWIIAKENPLSKELQAVCSTGINAFRLLIIYIKPVLPALAKKAELFLQVDPLTWEDLDSSLTNHKIAKFNTMVNRVESAKVNIMVDETKHASESKQKVQKEPKESEGNFEPEISVDDFLKIDLRVAQIISASEIQDADKLLKLVLDLGKDERGVQIQRTVFSGIKSAYKPEEMIGMLTVVVANLRPRKMKFGVSNGMVLATQNDGDIVILQPEKEVLPGAKIS